MVVKLQASELERLSRVTQARRADLQHIRQSLRAATAAAGWTSESASSFRDRWQEREVELAELEEILAEWQAVCRQHAGFATALNAAFK